MFSQANKKKYGHFSKWFLAEGRFPAASGVLGDHRLLTIVTNNG